MWIVSQSLLLSVAVFQWYIFKNNWRGSRRNFLFNELFHYVENYLIDLGCKKDSVIRWTKFYPMFPVIVVNIVKSFFLVMFWNMFYYQLSLLCGIEIIFSGKMVLFWLNWQRFCWTLPFMYGFCLNPSLSFK